jgi:hypothetical protein
MRATDINISVSGPYGRYAAGVSVQSYQEEAFAPLAVSDDRFIGFIAGDPSEATARKVVRLRDGVAAELAQQLTDMILDAMRKHDTSNGYPSSADGARRVL